MSEINILRSQSLVNRSIYQSRQVQTQKASDRSLEHTAKVLEYDAESGRYRVQNTAGQVFLARAISNGVFAKGSQVSLVTPVGGIPIIDAMPR